MRLEKLNLKEMNERKIFSRANCMGFAFNTNDWLHVEYKDNRLEIIYLKDEIYYCEDEETKKEMLKQKMELINKDLESATERLLQSYNLKLVEREQMENGKKYIAFRIGDEDFHFMLRLKNGNWFHKRGMYNIEKIEEEKVFSKYWINDFLRYDSEVKLFEVID